MTEKSSKHNYLVILVEAILFLVILCFLTQISRQFFFSMFGAVGLKMKTFLISVLSCFAFYAFIIDLNEPYKKIQSFFFKSSIFAYVVPFFLFILGIAYFILPRVFDTTLSETLFLFLGGVILVAHLIFVSNELKETTFSGFVNYLFFFSLLYLVVLIMFGLYLRAAFDFNIFDVFVEGIRDGASTLRELITEISG